MAIATITNKGQVTIPKAIREALGLGAGDKIEITLNKQGGAVILPSKPSAQLSVDNVFGMLHNSEQKIVSTEEMNQGIAQAVSARFAPDTLNKAD